MVTAVFPATEAEPDPEPEPDIAVSFTGLTQVGGTSNSVTTTSLMLTFDSDPGALTVDHITLTGATKGTLSGSGTTRNLTISAITVADSGTVSVTVSSPEGYDISGSPQTAEVHKAPVVITVDLLAIPSVVAPVRGAVPVTTAIDTAQYTGTINWTPAVTGSFAASTVYTATITLTAKSGWTLNGVPVNSFTVAGAAATNPANSGVVTAVFPATEEEPDIAVNFTGMTQVGGVSNTASTTSLTLTFDVDPGTLTAADISLTGATTGALTGSGLTRSLAISDITVADGDTVSVSIASPAGYDISGSPRTVAVYKAKGTVTVTID